MLILLGVVHDLCGLGFGYIAGVDAHGGLAFRVYHQHHTGSLFAIHVEEAFQHLLDCKR